MRLRIDAGMILLLPRSERGDLLAFCSVSRPSFPNSVWERIFPKLLFRVLVRLAKQSFENRRSQTEFGNEVVSCCNGYIHWPGGEWTAAAWALTPNVERRASASGRKKRCVPFSFSFHFRGHHRRTGR